MTAITTPTLLIGTWYGMNFKDMPELELPYAYPVAALITVVSTILPDHLAAPKAALAVNVDRRVRLRRS